MAIVYGVQFVLIDLESQEQQIVSWIIMRLRKEMVVCVLCLRKLQRIVKRWAK